MRNIIKKILRESDELNWVREVNPLPPFPLSEEDLSFLVGWSFLYDEHAHLGRWSHDGKLFKITQVLGDTIYWLYGKGNEENYDNTSSFVKLINNGTWVLVSPEGVLYDPLYAREWKGGTYYSKKDLNESHEWDWAQSEKLYNPFDEPLAVIWFDRVINRDEAEVLFGLMSEAGISSHRSKQNLIKLFMGISKDSYLRIFRSNHYGQHFSIGSYDPHPDASSFDDNKYIDVHKDLIGKPYLEYNVSDLFGNTINESEDLQWIKDVDPMDPYQPYVGMKWKVVGLSKYHYEIYEVVGLDDEIMSLRWKNDREGYVEDDYKLVTYFSLVRGGNVEIVYDDINESSDGFDWARGSSLTPLTDYIETYGIKEIDIPNKLVGLRVILSPKSQFYGEGDDSNPINVKGTIGEEETHDNELTIMVDWDNGEFNSYAPSDLDLVIGGINESEDPLQWIKDIEPEIRLEPNTIYWFKPNLTRHEIVDFAGKINNSDYFSGFLSRIAERPDVVEDGLKYFIVEDGLELGSLGGWCTEYPIKYVIRDNPSAKLVDAREKFGYN